MKFKKGYNRFVIILYGIAIKLPRIRIYDAIHVSYHRIKKGLFIYTLKMHYENSLGLWYHLFKGIIDNWEEFRFYKKNRMNILMPTYFSLFGFINIQKAGKMPKVDYLIFWAQIKKITNEEAFKESHTFSNPENFCEVNNHLKMFDYGSSIVREVLKKYGEKIYNEFDFSLCKK